MSKFTDITPSSHRCAMSMACPSVCRSEDGREYEITGRLARQVTPVLIASSIEPAPQYEATVRIPAEILEGALGIRQGASADADQARGQMLGEIDPDLAVKLIDEFGVGLHAMYVTNTNGSPRWEEALWGVAEGVRMQKLLAADRLNAAASRSMSEMLARIAELEEGLKPFARAYRACDLMTHERFPRYSFSKEELRHAASLLQTEGEGNG
jgi:hypothetical protein